MHPLDADKIRRVIRVEEPLEGRDVRRIYIYNNALQLYACRPLINFGIKVNRRSRSGFARLIPPSGALLNYSWWWGVRCSVDKLGHSSLLSKAARASASEQFRRLYRWPAVRPVAGWTGAFRTWRSGRTFGLSKFYARNLTTPFVAFQWLDASLRLVSIAITGSRLFNLVSLRKDIFFPLSSYHRSFFQESYSKLRNSVL